MIYEECVNFDRIRFLAPLALLAIAACKEDGGLNERMVADPATGEDAAVPAPADAGGGGFQFPFDLDDIFGRRDAGRPGTTRDAGQPVPDVSGRVGGAAESNLQAQGIALHVPAGALRRAVEVTISELPNPPRGFAGRAWLISPPETSFAVDAFVAIWPSEEMLDDAPANEWAVATLQNGAWVALPGQSNDVDGTLVFAPVKALGAFALIKVPPRDGLDASAPDASAVDASAEVDASVADAAITLDASLDDSSTIDAELALDADAAQVDAEAVDSGPTTFCPALACEHGKCIEGLADFGCDCDPGFTLAPDLHSCMDVDECAAGTLICPVSRVCVNTPGSAQCTCPVGSELTPSDTCAVPCLLPAMLQVDGTCAAPVCAPPTSLQPDGTCVVNVSM